MKYNMNEACCPDVYGVYIHIPFCKQKCFYCDFPSFAGRERLMEAYVEALCRDIRVKAQAYCSRAGEVVSPATIYVGGGTPTYLPTALLERLLAQITTSFQLENIVNTYNVDNADNSVCNAYIGNKVANKAFGPAIGCKSCPEVGFDGEAATEHEDSHCNAVQKELRIRGIANSIVSICNLEKDEFRESGSVEFTMEANPGTLTPEKLVLLRKYGVNRLSIGVQTFCDVSLKRIGRIHSSAEAVEAVRLAKAAGFVNISIDLIYGLPGQTLNEVKANLEQAMELGIQHISVYGLQLEEGTVLYRQQEMGKLQLPDDDIIEAMYDYIMDYLPQHGYERYEISNFALAGKESQHNLSYWRDVPYLGIGAGAHAYWQGCRYENPTNIKEYIELVEKIKETWQLEEVLSEKAHMEEFCFLGLRTVQGIKRKDFYIKFGRELEAVYGEVIRKLQGDGLLDVAPEGIRLTKLGMKYGNQVFSQFLLG